MILREQILRWFKSPSQGRAVKAIPDIGLVLASDRGLRREENQDRVAAMRLTSDFRPNASSICVAVADGMGGLSDGAQCAELTIASFFDALVQFRDGPIPERLERAARIANEQVHELYQGRGGATLSAILVDAPDRIGSVNVGDSRIYIEREVERGSALMRITVDDNMEEAFGGQGRELVQFIGVGRGLRPHVKPLPSFARSVAITTDGVHFLDPTLLEQIYTLAPDSRAAAERLVALARWYGGPDNATIAVLKPHETASSEPIHGAVSIEIWGLQDNLKVLLPGRYGDLGRSSDAPPPRSPPKETETKRRSARRTKPEKTEKNEKAEQLKINIDLGNSSDGSDS